MTGRIWPAAAMTLAILSVACEAPVEGSDTSPAMEDAKALCDKAYSAERLAVLLETSLISGTDLSDRRGYVVVVRRPIWEAMPLDDQKRLAATFDCAFAGPDHYMKSISFRTSLDGPELMRLEGVDLYRLRAAGYADRPQAAAG